MTTIIFDLDGTLIDTTPLVVPAFRAAVAQYPGNPIPSDEAIQNTFGIPDVEIWRRLLPNASESERAEAFSFAEAHIVQGMYQTDILLPYAREVLAALKDRGYTLTVASNCGVRYMDGALDSQKVRAYVVQPLCLGSVAGTKKADILSEHFRRFDRKDAYMVGDRSTDIEAAEAHQIPAIGCAFGFGNESELRGASQTIRSLKDLLHVFP